MTARDSILALGAAMNAEVLGQPRLVERMLIGLLADGHLLIEGLPGLAKTRAVKAMARHLKADFSRIQFTPDLLPSDVTGTDVYYSEGGKGEFKFQPGPVFGNLLLADEINRAPAKVQAALLEAMEERQVTVGQQTHPLPDLFMVLATQNPIEQEGTYPLPEAQTDRFLMKVLVDYPAPADETEVLRLVRSEEQAAVAPAAEKAGETPKDAPIALDDVFAARREIAALHIAEAIETYIIDLVNATRQPAKYSEDLGRADRARRQPARRPRPRPLRPRPRLAAGRRLRLPRRHPGDRPGRAPPPRRALLRGDRRRADRRRRPRRPDQARRLRLRPRCPPPTRASMSTCPTSRASKRGRAASTSCRASRSAASSPAAAPPGSAAAGSSSRSCAPTCRATTSAPSTGRSPPAPAARTSASPARSATARR